MDRICHEVTYVRASRYQLALDIKSHLTYSAWSHPNGHFAKSLIIFFFFSESFLSVLRAISEIVGTPPIRCVSAGPYIFFHTRDTNLSGLTEYLASPVCTLCIRAIKNIPLFNHKMQVRHSPKALYSEISGKTDLGVN